MYTRVALAPEENEEDIIHLGQQIAGLAEEKTETIIKVLPRTGTRSC
jgi:hypothetical protein